MSSSPFNQSPNRSRFQHSASFERRPKLLKDFLRNDSFHSSSSKSTVQLVSSKSNKSANVLLRSRSKRTISAIHKVINVVKFFPFASVKSPLVLPRSFSRKSSKRTIRDNNGISPELTATVKVRDILRWRSFRDLAEEKSSPLDFPLPPSPNRSTTTSATSHSRTSSWSDRDFTAENSPLRRGENEDYSKKHSGVWECGEKMVKLWNPKEGWPVEESDDDQQQSPVSVLETFDTENEHYFSHFHQSLANIQRTKCNLTRRIQEFEALINLNGDNMVAEEENEEEATIVAKVKAEQLVNRLDIENGLIEDEYALILDFCTYKFSASKKFNDDEFDNEILKIARSWLNGECGDSYEWEMEDKKEANVKDMEKGVEWNKFKEEKEEVSMELQVEIWENLVNELLEDCFFSFK